MAYSFISGATGGIGRAFAIELAKRGCALFLTGRSQGKLSALKAQLNAINPNLKVESFLCDLREEKEVNELFAFVDSKKLKFDRLVNVAGVDTQMAFKEYSQEKIATQLKVNVNATINITHEILKRKSKTLEILTVASMSGATPMPYFALYSASKAMLINFFTALHYELKKDGVKVTTVLPGGVPTRQDVIEQIKAQGVWGKISAKSPQFVAEKSLNALKKNKVKYIPGVFNKILYAVVKLLPRCLVLRFIAHRWKKLKKDAF